MSDYIVVGGIKVASGYSEERFHGVVTCGPRFLLPVGNKGDRKARQVCICDCGQMFVAHTASLRAGLTKTCGCGALACRTTHNMCRTSEYIAWENMKQRCFNANNPVFKHYGGRGISVCKTWIGDGGFGNFLKDLGPKPNKSSTLERVDVNGNYCKDNCIWIDCKLQLRNQRRNRNITFNGTTQCLVAWAQELGMRKNCLEGRLNKGWSIEKAMTTPVKTKTKHPVWQD